MIWSLLTLVVGYVLGCKFPGAFTLHTPPAAVPAAPDDAVPPAV